MAVTATRPNSVSASIVACTPTFPMRGAMNRRPQPRMLDLAPMNEPALPAGKVIDPRAFWRAIGHRATGSTVVTARSEAGPAGFLGLSATHLTADPPLMLVSIDKRTSALQTILTARHFALNFLPRDAA